MTTTIEKLTTEVSERDQAREAAYRQLVSRIANEDNTTDDCINVTDCLPLLIASGRTIDDLQADVETHQKRMQWVSDLAAIPGLIERQGEVDKQLSQAGLDLSRAQRKYEEIKKTIGPRTT